MLSKLLNKAVTQQDWPHDNQDLCFIFTLWCSCCSSEQHVPAKWENLLLMCGCLNGNLCRESGWGTVWTILPWQPWISFIHLHLHPSFLAFSQIESSKIIVFSIAEWNRSLNLLLTPRQNVWKWSSCVGRERLQLFCRSKLNFWAGIMSEEALHF